MGSAMTQPQTLEQILEEMQADIDAKAHFTYEDAAIMLSALKLAIQQRDEALNWAVDDLGRVIHELAPPKNAQLADLLRGEA